jgi:hypothetical protein
LLICLFRLGLNIFCFHILDLPAFVVFSGVDLGLCCGWHLSSSITWHLFTYCGALFGI